MESTTQPIPSSFPTSGRLWPERTRPVRAPLDAEVVHKALREGGEVHGAFSRGGDFVSGFPSIEAFESQESIRFIRHFPSVFTQPIRDLLDCITLCGLPSLSRSCSTVRARP